MMGKKEKRWKLLGEELIRLREQAGFRLQKQVLEPLSKLLGHEIASSTVSSWETGKGQPTAAHFAAIAHLYKADPVSLLYLLFLAEPFDHLSDRDRERSELLWEYCKAGAQKLSEVDPVEGSYQVRALTTFAKEQHILDRAGALAWQKSLSNVECFWVATLDFRDHKETEFYEMARDNIKNGAMYVYFIRDEYVAKNHDKEQGIEKEFDRFRSKLQQDIGMDAVNSRVVSVTFHEGEQIAAVDFVVANPHKGSKGGAVGFHVFDRIDPTVVYNIKLSANALDNRIDKLIEYLDGREDKVSKDQLFPSKSRNKGFDFPRPKS